MSYLNDARAKDFISKEGIDKIHIADDNYGVAADWSTLGFMTGLKYSGWLIDNVSDPSERDSIASCLWRFKRGEEKLRIEIIASSKGNAAALNSLMEFALGTTSMEVPFKKAEGLGDYYLVSRNATLRDRLWIYRNVCFDLRYSKKNETSDFDTFALAKDIQAYAEKHLVRNISDYYPRITHNISLKKIYVGDTFDITLSMAVESPASNYVMELKLGETLDLVSQDGLTIRVKAIQPGPAEVKFVVIDRKTLLSSEKTVKFDVLEKGR
ncbi:MAG: hypothetical protein ABFD62_04730 [Syntrophaceae bacterium]